MTITEAKKICLDHHRNTERSADDEFMYTEALKYLVEETKSPSYMLELGGYYYGNRFFDLALKYYELAAEYNNVDAISALGYIWYYGRRAKKTTKKLFTISTRPAEWEIPSRHTRWPTCTKTATLSKRTTKNTSP